jgi:Flp pilus assembly protein TadD
MPLEEFWTVYIRGPGAGSDGKAVNHVEQMYESLCFQRSPRGEFGCTSCHNPHEALASERRVEHYRDGCLRCHHSKGCELPEPQRREQEPEDSCIACHMPRSETSDIAHVAATDHRIVRQPGQEPQNRRGNRPPAPLLDFYRGAPNAQDLEQGRDLGVALYQMSLRGMPLTDADADFIIGLLDTALDDWPDDTDAWKAKGKILHIVRRPDAAIEAFEQLLEQWPKNETALVTLGQIHGDLQHQDRAVEYWRKAIEVNPYVAEYHKSLVLLLAERNAWDEARTGCRTWLDLDPGSWEARRVWVECLLQAGRRDKAIAEFDKIRALKPPQLDELEAWFRKRTQ